MTTKASATMTSLEINVPITPDVDNLFNSDLGKGMEEITPSTTTSGQRTKTYKHLACLCQESLMKSEDTLRLGPANDCQDDVSRPYFSEETETLGISCCSDSSYPLYTSCIELSSSWGFDSLDQCIPVSLTPPYGLFECQGDWRTPESSSLGSSIVVSVPSTPRKPSYKSGAVMEREDGKKEVCGMRKCLGGMGEEEEEDDDDDDDLKISPRLLWKRDDVDEKEVVGDDPFL